MYPLFYTASTLNWIKSQPFFLSTESLSLDLGFVQYRSPDMQVGIFFFVSFFTGVIISYFFSLIARFNAQKTIKNLNKILTLQREKIKGLEKK
ncbi:MAG: LapA family protein [Deltaproteobacteria bacterium]|nr:LapA family protein [Deltaproteobacteria bacterium]